MVVSLLLLLLAAVHAGSSYRRIEKDCGSRYKIVIRSDMETITFTPESSIGNSELLWQRGAPLVTDKRRKESGIYFVINNLLKRDSGRYTARDSGGKIMVEDVLVVKELKKVLNIEQTKELSFSFPLEEPYCNIYFIPYGIKEYALVLRGRSQEPVHEIDCQWFHVTIPCGIQNAHMDSYCAGDYVIRDDYGDAALVVHVNMEIVADEPVYLSHIGTACGIFFLMTGCCGCVKVCCCRKKSKKRDSTDDNNVDDPPATGGHNQYDTEPVRRTPAQVNQPTRPETNYPPQPPQSSNDPPTYNPTLHIPPSYAEVSAPLDPPPHYSEVDPRFELTVFPSAPPLSSDTDHCDVYNSDKLNFL